MATNLPPLQAHLLSVLTALYVREPASSLRSLWHSCGILCPSEAQLGPPSIRDAPWASLCYRSAWDLPSVRDGPWTSPRSKLQAHLIADNDDCSAAQS